jgi:signal transduction histidine kinase
MSRLCEILRKWGVWPTHEEGFQEEVDRLSRQGLRVIGIVEIVNPIVMIAVDALAVPYRWNHPLRLGTSGAIVALGVVTILASRTAWGNRRARLLSILSGWLAAGILTSGSLALAGEFPGSEHYIPAQIAAVLLVGAVVIPVEPLQALGLGLAIQATYAALGALAARLGVFVGSETDAAHHVFVGMLTGLTTALTAVVYRQRLATWRAHQEALRVLRDLRHAQSRALLSENAAALGRLAAALCHELNSPLGALTSAVDTLFLLSSRRPAAAGDHARLEGCETPCGEP